MNKKINVYSDESCHLESKQITSENRFMVIGGISCPGDSKRKIFNEIKRIKTENGLQHFYEMKWTKISLKKYKAYEDLIRYFFSCDSLSFRAVVIDKEQLDHKKFGHTHDDFYYKMYWQMLEWFIEPSNHYHIYLDIKDTKGYIKVKKLQEVLCNTKHDFDRKIIDKLQEIRSHEVVLTQLVDVIIGAVSYANRYPRGGRSRAKQNIVELIKELSQMSLLRSTSLGARKFNIFCWEGKR